MLRNTDRMKNSITQEFDIPRNLDLLNKWTIPRIEPKTIYQLGTFEKLGLKQIVKTSEESISLNNEEMVIKLLGEKDIFPYRKTHKFLHIGLVQIAFKPLTLENLPESFIAALRDGRNLDWKKSLMGIIQSSLAHGPVYFDVYPNLQLSLSDINILDSLTMNVKTHGYNYAPGSEIICICYRIYYKPLHTLNPMCKIKDKSLNETILIETNFSKSNITTRRSIKWEEIPLPDHWQIANAVPRTPVICQDVTNIFQSSDGNISVIMNSQLENIPRNISRSSSMRSFISPFENIQIPYEPTRASTSQLREADTTSQIRENYIKNLSLDKNNIVKGINDSEDPTESEMDANF